MPYWYFPDDDDDHNDNARNTRDPLGRPAIGARGRSERLPPQPGPEVNVPIHLTVNDNPRVRASSTGARPQPNLIPSNIDNSFVREAADQRARLDLLEEENSRLQRQVYYEKVYNARRRDAQPAAGLDADLIDRLARLNAGQDAPRRYSSAFDATAAAQLARLEELERHRRQEDDEHRWRHRLDDTRLRDDERRKSLQTQFEADRRRAEQEEQEIIDRAELKRRDKEAAAKAERARVVAEEKAKMEQEKQEQKEQRERILYEEEQRRVKEKEDKEQTRLRVLAEEKARIKKEKEKEEKEEEEFHAKVREKFVRAGYSPDYIEAILHEKRKVSSKSRALLPYRRPSDLAIDIDRPTYIRVQEKHLLPETLDAYGLPWEYDPQDRKYIFIKRYISHDTQQELFTHSADIIRRRRTKYLLTDGSDGYTKETISTTTLRPGLERVKSKDGMYLVRSRSTSKSKSPRRGFFF